MTKKKYEIGDIYLVENAWKTTDRTGIGPLLWPLLGKSFTSKQVFQNIPLEELHCAQMQTPDPLALVHTQLMFLLGSLQSN
ncbi:hypothetical protein ACFLWX_03905 [Chloroflexota bacterium]